MTTKVLAASVAAILCLAAAAQAQEAGADLAALDAQLPGTLANDPTRLDWETQGEGFKSEGVRDPAIPGGGAAREFDIRRPGPHPYSIQAYVPLTADIDKGETLTVGFYARALEAETDDGKGSIGVRFQQNLDPWPGFGDATVKIGPEWQWHEVSAVSTMDIAKQNAVVTLQLAGARQKVQIGQTIVVKGAPAIQTTTAVLAPEPELPPQLQGAGKLIARPDVRNWQNSGPAGSWADRADETIWLGKATRYTVAEKGQNRWDVATAIPIGERIEAGDKLLIAVAARTESASTPDGKAVVGIRVQDSVPPYAGFADNLFKVGPNWQLIRIQTTATQTLPAGQGLIALHFAEAPQVVDIGPVYVFKTE